MQWIGQFKIESEVIQELVSMPLITDKEPDAWEQLEQLVTAILNECGMNAQRGVSLNLPRGNVSVDVIAEEIVDGISHSTICECKNWQTKIPKEVVHAFRTVMQETGAHRGYIISKVGFQKGAFKAAEATNIELVTFAEFQNIYFDKWIIERISAIEKNIGNFHTYYEPIGKPGYLKLKDDGERAAYDLVWKKYLFAGMMLIDFSPYIRLAGPYPFPELPFDGSKLEKEGIEIPDDILAPTAYREFLEILEGYASEGLKALRAVNPITRDQLPGSIERDD